MKKLLTLSVAALAAIGMSADPVDLAKARQLAAGLSVNDPVLVTKAVRTEAKARRLPSKVQSTSPYYIFSRGEGQGFVIVSGDDCLPDILGYTESGDFDEAHLPPHLIGWLNYYKGLVEDAQEAGQNISRKSPMRKSPNRVKGWEGISPLITTHWHQNSPYNDRCPFISGSDTRAVTGCVATAAAQVIYYYRKDNPDTFLANTPTYGADEWHHTAVTDQIKKGTPIKWGLMLEQYSGSEPAEFRSSVADLVYAVGAMDHMDYYFSSGAQISDLVSPMNTFFNLESVCEYKSDATSSWVPLATWEKRIYDDLAAGHPIVYTGYKDEATGGHAVVLDGYQSSTGLFHFNFGWGGQGDGWYTVDDETGMNYFKSYQGMTYKIAPKKQNLEGRISLPKGFYAGTSNPVTVKVKNHGTLNYSGIYLFCSTSSSKPSAIGMATSKDTETVLSNDGTEVELSFTARPTSTRAYTLTLTDARLNVLAKLQVTPEKAAPDLCLRSFSVDASTDVETFDGQDYQVVYNKQAAAHALVDNLSAVGYEGSTRLYLSVYDETAKAWTPAGYTIGRLVVGGNENVNISYLLTDLEQGKFYEGRLAKGEGSTANNDISNGQLTDTVVRFILKEGDLEVVGFDNNCLALKGHFDPTAFASSLFSGSRSYKTATTYDLTQCSHVGIVSQSVNPNALIYVSGDSEAAGVNVVKDGRCANLLLAQGYDFAPKADFTAEKAQLTFSMEPGRWFLLTSPFEATVPDGIIAREILSHTKSGGIRNATADVKRLEAGKTYLAMTSWTGNRTLEGENVKVLAVPVANADTAVVGTFVTTTTPAGAQLLDEDEYKFFVPVDEGSSVEALHGYWCASDLTTTFRIFTSSSLDPAYINLAQSINEAHLLLEKYRDIVTSEAYNSYLSEIQEAEHLFSNRNEDTSLPNATQVNRYADQLLADGIAYSKQIENVGNMEIDFTSNIVNPSFETRTGTPTGWTLGKKDGYTSLGSVVLGTSSNINRTVGLDGSNVFQSLIAKADSSSVRLSQEVTGLTPGYYRLTALVGTDTDATVTLFAGDSTVTVGGHAFGRHYLTKATIDRICVEADEDAATGSLTIGVEEGHWYKADAFTLAYIESFPSVDGDATAIDGVSVERTSSITSVRRGIYTLQGAKVDQITRPGIYIVNGKKCFVKP